MSSSERIQSISNQLKESSSMAGKWPLIIENEPQLNWKPKQTWFKTDGWGYKDTKFTIIKDKTVTLTGNKYTFANKQMPYFVDFVEHFAHAPVDKNKCVFPQKEHIAAPPLINDNFIQQVSSKTSRISFENSERVMHSYGHTLQEMYMLKYGKFDRYCDVVLYPSSHEQVEVTV
jgi:alkyldihydroxyacetonephosphate synthase